ncbi:hypothetical protein FOMA001_g17831 [Fusarium oxysporum f. sp. matthiolae]|nr:hypothetical protein FOMA001_g17831 [Fusarium oxysporum f. sp. matthiolae]
MAEVIGLAASVIAIIDLSAKVATLCLQYSTAVGNARDDIVRLRRRLDNLVTTLQGVRHLLSDLNNPALATSRKLLDSVEGCTTELAKLQGRLDSGKARMAMRRFGLRAFKWPFDSKEVSGIISNLERHEQTITLSLQIDQTTLLLNIRQRIEGVSLQPEEDASIVRKPCFTVPFERDPDFVDRPDIIAWLKEQYTRPAGRMALVGMGGFGKSQVAIQFAHYIRDIFPETSVFWVHASSKPRFEEAYRSIADRLQLPKHNDPGVDVLGLVRDWLQGEEAGPWLMVLDNVDNLDVLFPKPDSRKDMASRGAEDIDPSALSAQQPLASLLPKCRGGTILVTSRSMDAAEKLIGTHKAVRRISAMGSSQAMQLFRNKLEGGFDEDTGADLLRALDFIPLAITQAAAYINRRAPRVSVRVYLDTIRKSDKKKGNLLNSDTGDLRRDETVSNSVVTTWQVTFEQIRCERPSAANLLSFMSFFNPQGIPEFVLHNYKGDLTDSVDEDADCEAFEDDLDVLRGYSLVSVAVTGNVFEMHSLVQFCTKVWLSRLDDASRWKQAFLRAMSKHFPSGTFETWPTCQMLLPHIESIVEEEPPETELQQWTHLLANCAWYLLTIGSYARAEKLNKEVVKWRTTMLGEEHPDTLTSMSSLASIYRDQGRWKEAEELEVRVMEARKTVLGEEHPDTLTSMSNLALTYRNQGRWKEAEDLGVRVMKARKTMQGEEQHGQPGRYLESPGPSCRCFGFDAALRCPAGTSAGFRPS